MNKVGELYLTCLLWVWFYWGKFQWLWHLHEEYVLRMLSGATFWGAKGVWLCGGRPRMQRNSSLLFRQSCVSYSPSDLSFFEAKMVVLTFISAIWPGRGCGCWPVSILSHTTTSYHYFPEFGEKSASAFKGAFAGALEQSWPTTLSAAWMFICFIKPIWERFF